MVCKECKVDMWFDKEVESGYKFVCKKCGKEKIQTKKELQEELRAKCLEEVLENS